MTGRSQFSRMCTVSNFCPDLRIGQRRQILGLERLLCPQQVPELCGSEVEPDRRTFGPHAPFAGSAFSPVEGVYVFGRRVLGRPLPGDQTEVPELQW